MLMVLKSAPFCFSSPLFNNQPIMSPRDGMCQEKMAKKAFDRAEISPHHFFIACRKIILPSHWLIVVFPLFYH
jgi:hypothetical protein